MTPLPEHIKSEMRLFRLGLAELPTSYIEHHESAARRELMRSEHEFGLTIHSTSMVSDGWGDGMLVVQAIVETVSGRLLKLVWHSQGGEGVFFIACFGGGSRRSSEEELR